MDKLPPLAWIRAFREAGRQGSFKEAAEALHVSPSTISHQIRKLEQSLAQPLFDRSQRQLQLTTAGQALYQQTHEGFSQIEAAFASIQLAKQRTLRLGMFPFVANELLLPRLTDLEALVPTYQIELSPDNHLENISDADHPRTSEVHGAIRYDAHAPSNYAAMELTTITLMAVITADPELRDKASRQRITISGGFSGWQTMADGGMDLTDRPVSPTRFDSYLSGLRAVEQGYGLGIAVLPLSGAWLRTGRAEPYEEFQLQIPERYWLVFSKASPHRQALESIGAWLQQLFAEEARLLEQKT